MQKMSTVTVICSAAFLLTGCAKTDQAAKDSVAAAPATPAPAPVQAISLADVAGKWQVRSAPESGPDTTSTSYVLTATANTTGWFITFPTGLKVPITVMASGDSLVETTGTFASQRRKGVKVHTESTLKMQGGKLVGTTTAHYTNAGADSVLRLRTEGTKIPK
jgi:major membrane immunogen (membrane-anchored lipoprotein)